MKGRLDLKRIEVVDRAMAEILRGKTPAERVAMTGQANNVARMLMAAGIRARNPDWSENDITREIVRRMTDGTG
ncbi:MAG: hypothetical protein ACRC7O_01405 [Fimbriiglobus sp.]